MSRPASADCVARAREVFCIAVGKSSQERAELLAHACAGDVSLREAVEDMLRRHENIGDFLESPAVSAAAGSDSRISTSVWNGVSKVGDRIGRYRLLEKLGEGGWGVVYRAEQEEPVRREVALKIIKVGMDTNSVIARFEAERQAVAMMDHPGIAKALDAGATETGRPYFVMELVRGVRITRFCDEHACSTEQRLALFMQVCHAIQHAHEKGVIHRDIKPANILVATHDGVPLPKVIDFGIVKASEQPLNDNTPYTEFRTLIGTPAYMSPEQAEGNRTDLDQRSDIYSLGVLLYEMLTGTIPLEGVELMNGGLEKCRRVIRETEPALPSTRLAALGKQQSEAMADRHRTTAGRLFRSLRRELDWIVMKCLEKDRGLRYATAGDLAADVGRYLKGDAVLARAPTKVYRFRKLVWRRRMIVMPAAAVVLALLAGLALSGWLADRAAEAERLQALKAEQDREAARLNEYVADISLAKQLLDSGNYGRAIQLLKKHRPKSGEQDFRGFAWSYLWAMAQGEDDVDFPSQGEPVKSVAFSPNSEFLAVGSENLLKIWQVQTRTLIKSERRVAASLAFLPDGKSLLVGGPGTSGEVRVLDTADWSERATLTDCSSPIARAIKASRAAVVTRDGVRIWDTETWRPLLTVSDAIAPFMLSPDGGRLAADSRSGVGLKIWNLNGSQPELLLENSSSLFSRSRNDRAVSFSSDGALIVAARNVPSRDGVFILGLWNSETGQEMGSPDGTRRVEHTGGITGIAVSPDGRTMATASKDYSVRLWDYVNGRCRSTLRGHLHEVLTVAFSGNGQFVASGSRDGAVKLWATNPRPRSEELTGVRLPLGLSTNGQRLIALTRDGQVALVNVTNGSVEKYISLQVSYTNAAGKTRIQIASDPVVSTSLNTLAAVLPDRWLKVWHIDTGKDELLANPDQGNARLALSPDGSTLVSGGPDLSWWDLWRKAKTSTASAGVLPLFSGDGRRLIAIGPDGIVEVWDSASRQMRNRFNAGTGVNFALDDCPVAVSFDGSRIALAGSNDVIEVWSTQSAQLMGSFIGHKQAIASIAFCPDAKTLVSASDDGTLKFWNLGTQQELLTARSSGGAFRGLAFAADGSSLVAGTSLIVPGGGVRVFRAAPFADINSAEEGRPAR